MTVENSIEGITGAKDQSLWQQHEPLAVVVINLRIALRDAVEFRESIDPKRLEILLTEVDRALAVERNTSYQNGYRDGSAERGQQ